jgi:hypothetical protein
MEWCFLIICTNVVGTLLLWKNKLNVQPSLHKNVEASCQIDSETL